jgi:hypothetical protein
MTAERFREKAIAVVQQLSGLHDEFYVSGVEDIAEALEATWAEAVETERREIKEAIASRGRNWQESSERAKDGGWFEKARDEAERATGCFGCCTLIDARGSR